jgi:uncharacterized protein
VARLGGALTPWPPLPPARERGNARLGVVLSLVGLLLAGALAAREVPFLSGRVVDEAGLLPPEARTRIDQKLAALETETGAQVAVLTVASLEGDPIEDFSVRVADTWKLGRKATDDGVLLLIARDDRQMRLEIGYGLEGKVTDLQSSLILDDIIRPAFRRGDFAGGIEQGVDALGTALRGGEVTPPARGVTEGPKLFGVLMLLMLAVFSLAALATRGLAGWILYLVLLPFYYGLPVAFGAGLAGLGFLSAGAWLIGFPILRTLGRGGGSGGRHGGGWGSGWLLTGGSGGSWSSHGGGWGGGGFSGGGGSFGGGGASGSW